MTQTNTRAEQPKTSRTQSAPKRYAHALIRHFIIFSIFLPAYFSNYNNEYYQDISLTGILAILFTVSIWYKWPLDFKRHKWFVIALSATLLVYNLVCIYSRKHYLELIVHWKPEQRNITIAFIFFLTLLVIKDHLAVISDKVLKWLICSIMADNILALFFHSKDIGRIEFMNLKFYTTPELVTNGAFQWFYHTAAEYALFLLLYMALFMTYRKLFYNIWVYAACQLFLVYCISLTKAPGALLATGFLFGAQLIHYLVKRFPVIKENLMYIAPGVFAFSAFLLAIIFNKNEALNTKFLIWKGSLEVIRDIPQGFGAGFGATIFETNYVSTILIHPENTFLTHMLRHSKPVGIMFLLLFVVLIVFSALRKPNFKTFGIWVALLLMLCVDYTLQIMHLPLVLFLIYCIFFREKEKAVNE